METIAARRSNISSILLPGRGGGEDVSYDDVDLHKPVRLHPVAWRACLFWRGPFWPYPLMGGCGSTARSGCSIRSVPLSGRRAPTKWTVPLQWLVIVVAVLSFGLLVAAGPLLISMLTIPVVEPPSGLPPGISPGQLEQAAREARQSFIGVIVVEGLIALALLVLVVVGALRRWRWAFWLTVVLNAFNALNITAVPVLRHPPVALQVAGTIMDVIQAMTCVALLVAAIRIGPWACRREVAEETSSGQ
jgi:hypothetical protein